MSNMQDLFWCNARDEQGALLHALDCDRRQCFVVQGKKQENNTRGKAKMPNHHSCTSTCALVASASTTRMSATTSSACPPS